MKKVLLVAVAGMFVLASCKKEYTCECTYSGLFAGTPAVSTVIKDKKADAKTTCENLSVAGASTCTIK